MPLSTNRRASRAGVSIKQCRKGTMYIDSISGRSIFDGRRSRKSRRHERRIESFFSQAEKGGLD
jgi:hypothetical protein